MRNLCVLHSIKRHWHTALFVVLIFAWVVGGKAKIAASIVGIGAVLSLLLGLRASSLPEKTNALPKSIVIFLFGSSLAFPLLTGLHEYGMAITGAQGIDYAIFTQAIHNAGMLGSPIVSLVSPQPTNFLNHHFSPFLYPAGWLVRAGLEAHFVGIGMHVASIAGGLAAIYVLARNRGLSHSFVAVLICLTWAAPTMSVGMLWGIHDETNCLPFIGFGLYFWLKDRFWISAAMFGMTMLFKETMFLFVFAIPFALSTSGLASLHKRRDFWLPYSSIAMLGAAGAVGYWYVRPIFSEVSFDAVSRVGSVSQIFAWHSITEKAIYLFWVFAPSLFLGFFTPKGRAVLLLTLPFVGLSLISNFPEMYKALNYYSVVPGYIACFAAVVSITEITRWQRSVPMRLALVALALSFSQQGVNSRPLKTLRSVRTDFVAVPGSLDFIPDDFRVLVSDFDAAFVAEGEPVRLWAANRVDHQWDGILERKSIGAEISSHLRNQVVECYDDATWRLWCTRAAFERVWEDSSPK